MNNAKSYLPKNGRKKAIAQKQKWFILCFAILLSIQSVICVNAKEACSEQYEIVFLVDCSHSMNETDEAHYVADFIKEISCALPQNYKIGVVTYQSEVIDALALGSTSEEIEKGVDAITYQDYTNAGAGLDKALSLFTPSTAMEDAAIIQKIIMISDGEISMRTQEETEEAVELFRKALQGIKEQQIIVEIFSLGADLSEEANIYEASEVTGGKRYSFERAEDLAGFAPAYLFEECNLPNMTIGRINGKEATLHVTLPDVYMDRAKIMLLGEQTDSNANVICKASRMQVDTGAGYTLITLDNPTEQEVTIQMSSEQDMDVQAYLTAEYTISMQTRNQYFEQAELTGIYVDIKNPEGNSLFEGHLQNSKDIEVTANEKPAAYQIKQHNLYLEHPIAKSGDIHVEMQLPDSYAQYYGTVDATESIEVPIIEEEPKTDWFLVSIITLLVISLLLIFIWQFRKRHLDRKPIRVSDRKVVIPINGKYKEEDITSNKYDFCGKISVYVLQTKDGIEYPPESLNLFARCGRETITLQWILDACNLPLVLEGADRILFKPGEQRTLLVKNNSKATALKGRDVLLKSHQYTMYYHEKVTFIFDDEELGTEIEIHYKDLKLNER